MDVKQDVQWAAVGTLTVDPRHALYYGPPSSSPH
ncbi:uncharacterized protein G2W53_016157 [Senna tora]|uniref:Uncharacterized protein n=1 Tax=Senna tora TaxID=362788 RepID=A0A834WXN7_9FABA|nr:uncharacterized protein G2W53_016151 [Senna tora]KAF7833824.1 uncharacterized protein G2W53_016157 [Senna tora]